jgi:hypothetical protein
VAKWPRVRRSGSPTSSGDSRRAVRAREATLSLLDEEVAPRVRFGVYPVYARTWLAFCLAELGDFSRAVVLAREADELALCREATIGVWHPSMVATLHIGPR